MPLDDLPEIKHPFTNYTLADAVKLAVSSAKLFDQRVPATLTEVREYIKQMANRCSHVWLTGAAALDVLDAAIDGKQLSIDNTRFR